ncbi:hypothetical protein F4801DRAFT_579222 [Xylaria longipes]|nr:hypothetical protein F4801DRAFT_579222 [Xylaria longipes]
MEAHTNKPPYYASCAQTPQDVAQGGYIALERPPASRNAQNWVRPQPLDSSWLERVLHLAFDLAIALLFAVSAIWVRKIRRDFGLAQIFNAVLYLSIWESARRPSRVHSNASDPLQQANAINMTGMTVVSHEVVRGSRPSVVRPLPVCTGGSDSDFGDDYTGRAGVDLGGFATQQDPRGWSGLQPGLPQKWGREAKDTRLCLADGNPRGEVGCIALASSTAEGVLIS